jgi:hypothetical protein
MSDEKCARCGEEGEDRRTLQMACFYAMEELGIPFSRTTLFSAKTEDLEEVKPPITVDAGVLKGFLVLESGTVRSSGELHPQQLYTLRVCKDCRADWMTSIETWFKGPRPLRLGPGTGVWIRENGTNREATPEEVADMTRKSAENP